MTKSLVLSLVLITCLYSQASGELRPDNASRRQSIVDALSPSGPRPITLQIMEMEVNNANNQAARINTPAIRGSLCIFYDNNSGLFFWRYIWWPGLISPPLATSALCTSSSAKIFVDKDQIVEFGYGGYLQSFQKATNLVDAERKTMRDALATLHRGNSAFTMRGKYFERLPDDFEVSNGSSIRTPAKIVDVKRENSRWILTVQCVWKELLILDDNFKLIGHQPSPGETAKYWIRHGPTRQILEKK